jgi:hypothetical protein
MKKIICSHGFGVRADSLGMFPEIAEGLPGFDFEMFDYNKVMPGGDIVVLSIIDQAQILQRVIDQADPGSVLLCHSQGCIIAGLVDLSKISQVILLAPPVHTSMRRLVNRLLPRINNVDSRGVGNLTRRDGTTMHLTNDYISSVIDHNPMELYKNIASTKPTVIVRATMDDLLGPTSFNHIENAKHIDIVGNHNFSGLARIELVGQLEKILQPSLFL